MFDRFLKLVDKLTDFGKVHQTGKAGQRRGEPDVTRTPLQPVHRVPDFFADCASQLRALTMPSDRLRRGVGLLADHLDARLSTPLGDGFDIVRSGDEERDRATLAAWLDAEAAAGAFCAPPWGRSNSQGLAWLVRNKHVITDLNLAVGIGATYDPDIAKQVNELGIDAAAVAIFGERAL